MIYSKQLDGGKNVIYLAACALHNTCPSKDAVEKMVLEDVYAQASRHSMQAITYTALSAYIKQYGTDGLDSEILKKWNQAHGIALKKLILMSLERERLLSFLEDKGIWYMPLKGVILLDYYSKLGLRQMSDNDILVDLQRREEIRDFMLDGGYEIIHYGVEHPDTYIKDGKFVFEIHHTLYSDIEDKKLVFEYYRDIKDRLVSDGKSDFGYRFTDDDFYIYIITHAHKHFVTRGNGIRSLADMLVMERYLEGKLNEAYIDSQLEKLGMTDYRRQMSVLSKKLLSKDCPPPSEYESLLNEQEMQMMQYHITSGVFGTLEQSVSNTMRGMNKGSKITLGSKIKYLLSRVFPNMDFYKINYPKAYKYRILLPFYWLLRIFRAVFHFKKSARELKTVMETERDNKSEH